MDLNLLGSRIHEIRKEKKLTLSELGAKTGVVASTIQRYETASISSPKIPVINAIAKALEVSPDWLMQKSEEKHLTNSTAISTVANGMIYVPVIDNVFSSNFEEIKKHAASFELIKTPYDSEDFNYLYFALKDDSMAPMFLEDDLVLVKMQNFALSGSYVVVAVDDEEYTLRKISIEPNKIILYSDNPYYPPRIFKGENTTRVTIFGKAVEVKRKV